MEQIHHLREYHGDLHDRNILVSRRGIRFDVKFVDFYHWGSGARAQMREDVIQLVRLLYDATGGRRHYAGQPDAIKAICCGLRRGLIVERFPPAAHLRSHLENFAWD